MGTSGDHQATHGYNQGAGGQNGWGGWKYLMKKLSIQKMIWKLATEQRTGTEVKHLLSI